MGPRNSNSSKEVWINFDPSPTDVVSTKVRTWNKTHPGNIEYINKVNEFAALMVSDSIDGTRPLAQEIVHQIMEENGARFLKPPDGDMHPQQCLIMSKTQAISKVVHALRTAYSRRVKRENSPLENVTSIKKKVKQSTPSSQPSLSLSTTATPKAPPASALSSSSLSPKVGKRRSSTSDSCMMYRAKAGTKQKLPKHLLNVISAVCNQPDAATAHRILDVPLGGVAPELEPNKERLTRLQIRHRFASAAAVGMSPIEFASKLLHLWGGTLVLTNKRESSPPKQKLKTPPPTAAVEGAAVAPNSAAAATLPAAMASDDQAAVSPALQTPLEQPTATAPEEAHSAFATGKVEAISPMVQSSLAEVLLSFSQSPSMSTPQPIPAPMSLNTPATGDIATMQT